MSTDDRAHDPAAAMLPGLVKLFFVGVVLAILVGAGIAHVTAPASGQPTVYPIDGDHPLATEQAIAKFEETGVARGNVSALDVGLVAAERHDDAELSGYYADVNKVFVCIDYRESIDRTLRIHIPDDYVKPRPGTLESLTSGHEASFRPVENNTAMAVTVRFNGPARACFAFTKASGVYFGIKDQLDGWLNNSTGISLPSFTRDVTEWSYVSPTVWTNSTSHTLDARGEDMTIQFDADDGPSTKWLAVPDCSNPAEQRVCQYDQPAHNSTNTSNKTIVLMSTEDSPPPIRYRYGTDTRTGLGAAVRDIQHALGAFLDDLGGWLGGGGR